MGKMQLLSGFCLVVGLCWPMTEVAGQSVGRDKQRTALQSLQGSWTLQKWDFMYSGFPHSITFGDKSPVLRIEGDRVMFTRGNYELTGRLFLDPSKEPAHFDVRFVQGGMKQTELGLYHQEGNKLILVQDVTDRGRPKSLDASDGRVVESYVRSAR